LAGLLAGFALQRQPLHLPRTRQVTAVWERPVILVVVCNCPPWLLCAHTLDCIQLLVCQQCRPVRTQGTDAAGSLNSTGQHQTAKSQALRGQPGSCHVGGALLQESVWVRLRIDMMQELKHMNQMNAAPSDTELCPPAPSMDRQRLPILLSMDGLSLVHVRQTSDAVRLCFFVGGVSTCSSRQPPKNILM